ncbi:phenylalanine N-monooxygenase-like [Hibiscus syriacus]|uniref:Phenylalanine N-monooxygenase-like n=1 Tax=Hibiscus syriacus TaxID=106335 RepID=A0A6A3D2D8_HIBSY|nr:uncharacterized protein LOC120204670 [Hibiscus syriacus]KAE8735770.1 phenylalanine N-monooxygenase-like [Hibiscus syriacus]
MAVVGGVSCGGNVYLQRQEPSHLLNSHNPNVHPSSFMVSDPKSLKSRPSTKISASKVSLQPLPKQQEKKRNELIYHKIDEWMRDSVVDIVKNLQESPLLVHVYSDDDNTTRIRTEKADESNWVSVKQKWDKGETPMPDGVIFVEQIQEEEDDDDDDEQSDACCRAWGIVVQGQGRGLAPACYLLKTCKVSSGVGLKCTHFCLVKVRSFRETALSQLKNCWLLQGNST